MLRTIIALTLGIGLGACVENIPPSNLQEGEENRGDIWLDAANKSSGGTANQFDLLVSAPSDKDQLIICEADHPEKCNDNAQQYHRITNLKGVTHPRSLFLIRKFTLSANMVLAMKAWKTNDDVAFGRVTDVKTEGSATPGSAASTTGPTKTYNEVATILNTRCAGCHVDRPGARRPTTPMNSYEVMFPNGVKRAYVDKIVQSVKGTLANVQRMPLGGGALQPTEIEALEAWERGGFKR